MLRQIDLWNHTDASRAVSDRKLRLFSCACGERCAKIDISESASGMEPMPWALRWANPDAPSWIKGPNRITQKEKAHILRDIVCNPFRPVMLPKTQRVEIDADVEGGYPAGYRMECPWFTPTVLAIAQAAYDERPGRKCERCQGIGGANWYEGGRGPRLECDTCHGSGRIEDGSLDPVTLAILADALEDAGMSADQLCEECAEYSRREEWERRACHGTPTGHAGIPHPILAHLRSPGPHVRGMWSLDLILGKE